MSFILDALRKSEHERSRSALPGIADAALVKPPPSRLPWLLGAVGVLLALNGAVLLVVLLRPARPEPGAPVPAAAVAPAASPTSAAPPASAGPAAAVAPPVGGIAGAAPLPPSVARDIRSLSAEARAAEARAAEARAAAAGSAEADRAQDGRAALDVPPLVAREPTLRSGPARARPVAADAGGARRPPAPVGATPPAAQSGGVPSIDDLAPQATAGLPPLAINLHVYSPDPAQRFVMLNGRRYVDGAQLQEGPTLERITPDGVILNHRGLRFLLPRP